MKEGGKKNREGAKLRHKGLKKKKKEKLPICEKEKKKKGKKMKNAGK